MKLRQSFKALSIQGRIIFIYVVLTVVTLVTLGVVIFSSWVNSAHDITIELSEDTNEDISTQIHDFFENPIKQNELNTSLIQNNYIDMSDQEERERFFILALRQYDTQVYSLGYGTVNGEYYGARRNEDGIIEIMRNDASTGGVSWYYSITDDLTADERVVVAGLFDARIRPWYTEAVTNGDTVFSPVYKHFIMEDLTVSLATPIYDNNDTLLGVISSHMILSNINSFLNDTLNETDGAGIIVESSSNQLIANTFGDVNYRILSDDSVHRTTIDELSDDTFQTALTYYNETGISSFYLDNDKSNDYFSIDEIESEGINWLVITSTPKTPLFASIIDNIVLMVVISAICIIVMIGIFHTFITRVLRPIDDLVEVSEHYAKSDFSKRATVYDDNELGKLAKSYNLMADSISQFVGNLETLVKERTHNLEIANQTLKESEQRFKILHNASFGGIAIHDQGYILDCNQGLSNITGYSMDELIGMDGLLLIAPDDRDRVRKHIAAGYEKPYEVEGKRKNKEIYPLKLEARNLPFEGKQVRVVEFRDITTLKTQEKLKQETEEQYRLLVSEMQLGLALYDIVYTEDKAPVDYTFANVNQRFEKLTKLNKEDVVGKSVLEVFPNLEHYWIDNLHTVANRKESMRYENYSKTLDKWLSVSIYIPKEGNIAMLIDDITENKIKQNEIEYLSYQDFLTDLPNRRKFHQQLLTFDQEQFYPLGIVMMDLNGLKLMNDAFGHEAGDKTLKAVASVLNDVKQDKDFVARIGGDEFTLLSPNCTASELEQTIDTIEAELNKVAVHNIEPSLAMGFEIKEDKQEPLRTILTEAENNMYKNKVFNKKSTKNDAIQTILQTLQAKYVEEKVHSERVSHYCKAMGEALDLKKREIKELEMAGLFHDIGKISIPDNILHKPDKLSEEEWVIMRNHTINGYQILRAADKYSNIANYAMNHHERIDGKGYPNGLKGNDISLFSKIICIADAFEAMTSNRPYRKAMSKVDAISELKAHAGTQFDKKLVSVFINKVIKPTK